MTLLQSWAATPLAAAIGWTLIHSLWEGASATLTVIIAMAATRSPRVRYAVGCFSLIALLVMTAFTFALVIPHATEHQLLPVRSGLAAQTDFNNQPFRPAWDLRYAVPWLAVLWLVGVWTCCLWRALSFYSVYQLRYRGLCAAPQRWLEKTERLCKRLSVSRPVTLFESALTEVPSVLGHLRPMILMPAGLLTGLTEPQLEALLVHELVHVRRCDYLVNLSQCLLECLMFYNPAVWWISSVIRAEREHCCDDVVVETTGDAHTYAVALTTVEEVRWAASQPSVAANGGSLVKRIRRILSTEQPIGGGGFAMTAATVAVISLTITFALQPFYAQQAQSERNAIVVRPLA
jgi:beta-lactamase regulating signal transducer with metallopeptidase domain